MASPAVAHVATATWTSVLASARFGRTELDQPPALEQEATKEPAFVSPTPGRIDPKVRRSMTVAAVERLRRSGARPVPPRPRKLRR